MDLFAVIISITTSISIFLIKARSIAQDDIRDDSLKRALISANLYFNSNGNLVKKVEKITGTDLNGDGKISNDETIIEEKKQGPIKGIFSAIKELFVICTTDFTGDAEIDDKKVDKVLEETNMKTAAEGLEELSDSIRSTETKEKIENAVVNPIVDIIAEDNNLNSDKVDYGTEEEKKAAKKKQIGFFRKLFGKKNKEENNEINEIEESNDNKSSVVEVIENNVDKITDIPEEQEIIKTTAPIIQDVVSNNTKAVKQTKKPAEGSMDEFLTLLGSK